MLKEVIGICGLVLIILGNLTVYQSKKIRRKFTYPLFILGGIFLAVYSFILNDLIFIVLQIVFVLASFYGWFKINKRINKK